MPIVILIDALESTGPIAPAALATGTIIFSSEAESGNVRQFIAEGELAFAGEAYFDHTLTPDAEGEIEFSGYANISPFDLLAHGIIEFEGSLGSTGSVTLNLFAQGYLEFSSEADASIIEPEEYILNFIIDILPDESADGRYIGLRPRLKVDGDEIPIISWTYTEGENTAGADLQVVLARIADRNLFEADSIILFELGEKDNLGWDEATMFPLLENGVFKGFGHGVNWGNNTPGDSVTVNIASPMNERLAVSIDEETIFYDSNRESVDTTEMEPVRDTEGNPYPIVTIGIPGMSIYDIFDRIFIDQCGFSAWQTNLPDFPIRRVDCPIGQSAFDAIKGHIGMFDPVIYPEDNTIWILDTTNVLPAGFPSPRAVSIDKYKQLSAASELDRIDGFLVQYSELESEFNFFTFRQELKSEIAGNTHITTNKIFKEFRHDSQPYVVVREVLASVETTTRLGTTVFGTVVETTNEDYLYGFTGLLEQREKTVMSRLPNLFLSTAGSIVYSMQEASNEVETFVYKQHPFKPKQKYFAQKTLRRRGLITRDTENQQLGEDFESEYRVSWRSGNVFEGMTVRFGDMYSRNESIVPLRNNQVRQTIKEVDEIRELVVTDYTEERVGDVGFGATSLVQRKVLVLDNYVGTPIDGIGIIDTLAVGEMPLTLSLPLAYRKLLARKTKPRTASLEVIGYDRYLFRGSVINATGRLVGEDPGTPEDFGNHIILGRTITGDFQSITSTYKGKEL